MYLVALLMLIIFFSVFGQVLYNVFVKDIEYKYDPMRYEGDYLVTGEEWNIAEEIKEKEEALKASWIVQDSVATKDWEEDFIEERFDETEAESEEHY